MGGNKEPKTSSTEVTLDPWYCKATFTVPATEKFSGKDGKLNLVEHENLVKDISVY